MSGITTADCLPESFAGASSSEPEPSERSSIRLSSSVMVDSGYPSSQRKLIVAGNAITARETCVQCAIVEYALNNNYKRSPEAKKRLVDYEKEKSARVKRSQTKLAYLA